VWKSLIEIVPVWIVEWKKELKRPLTMKEQRAQEAFLAGLKMAKRKTKIPVIAALIGLVGSGKTLVAKDLAPQIGATVLQSDRIRVHLRKQGERYEGAHKIAAHAAMEVLKQGGNVILDSDHAEPKKRKALLAQTRRSEARVIFIRITCDFDVMIGRIITANYRNRPDDFFGGASSKWQGSEHSKGAAVKIREMVRRIPHHYRWEGSDEGGGRWIPRKLTTKIFAVIDTTNSQMWKKTAHGLAERLCTMR